MSTQIRFDIDGLSRAIELGDTRYQLALYADDAEVSVVDVDQPSRSPRVLHGKPAIASWIEALQSQTALRRVLDREVEVDRVVLTEECQTSDGSNFRIASTAEVRGGQITRELVIASRPPTASNHPILPGHLLG
jgi:ketosteroid isomerase-like protein